MRKQGKRGGKPGSQRHTAGEREARTSEGAAPGRRKPTDDLGLGRKKRWGRDKETVSEAQRACHLHKVTCWMSPLYLGAYSHQGAWAVVPGPGWEGQSSFWFSPGASSPYNPLCLEGCRWASGHCLPARDHSQCLLLPHPPTASSLEPATLLLFLAQRHPEQVS